MIAIVAYGMVYLELIVLEASMQLVYLGILLTLFCNPLWAVFKVDLGCTSAILINSKTGKVLYEKNAFKPMYPASCTKIAFTLYALKFHPHLFDKRIRATTNSIKSMHESQKSKNNFSHHPSYVLEHDASHMGLKLDEEMRFYDLLEATMVVSADDASNLLAEVMGNGSIEKCVEDVNRYMRSLGLRSTFFKNPHGLHHPEHVSTAYDLAILSVEAMKHPQFREMAKKPRFLRPKTNKQDAVHLQSTNRLLVKGTAAYYAPAVGIKTGYHRRAGHCLVAQAEKNNRSLIAVVLQGKSRDERFKDTVKLFQAAFDEELVTHSYLTAGPQTFTKDIVGAKSALSTYTTEAITHSFYPSEAPEVRCQLVWHDLALPIKQGLAVGELHFLADGNVIKKATLFAGNSVDETFMHAFTTRYWPWALGGVILLVALAFFAVPRRRS